MLLSQVFSFWGLARLVGTRRSHFHLHGPGTQDAALLAVLGFARIRINRSGAELAGGGACMGFLGLFGKAEEELFSLIDDLLGSGLFLLPLP